MENRDKKEYNYIYFNFNHEKNKKYKIDLSSEYNSFDNLELIEEKELDSIFSSLIVKVYRLKILPELLKNKNNEFYIDIFILEEDKNNKHHYTFRFKDINRDFYDFNFKIEGIDILPLELDEQFEIYSDILRNKYKKEQNSKENEDFISSSLLFLKDKNDKFNLLFYILIFLQCFETSFAQNHLMIFDPKKIKGIGQIPERKLKPIKNKINDLITNPEKIQAKDEKSRQEIIKLFYSFALYFNLNFQKDKINEMFEKENICNYLYDKLLNYREFFKDLTLPKVDIIKLIHNSKKYHQILILLFYLGTDFALFLEVVFETREFIYKLKKEDMNNNKDNELYDNKIDIEKYVDPKKEDDIHRIFEIIEQIKTIIFMENEEMKLIKFSSIIIEKYSGFYNEINLEKLILLKSIDDSIREMDDNFECKCNLEEMIHKTGLIFIKNGKIKNVEILDFIKADVFFQDKRYNKKIYRPLDIFDGIDISLIVDKNKFVKKWKSCNFYLMFESQLEDFLKKVASLITQMKDFGYLYKFYKLDYEKSLRAEVIKNLQNKFIELLPTYHNEECTNFIEDIVELIFLSDQKKVELKIFVSKIEKKLDKKTVNIIYINLFEKHKDLSKECNKIILKYLIDHIEYLNSISLACFIDKCNNIKKDKFSYINKYILKQNDIFEIKESENYIFFKEIVKRKIIGKLQNSGQKYIMETKLTIDTLKKNVKNCEIKFNILYPFFKEKSQMEEILKERFSIIFIDDSEGCNYYFEILKSKVLTIIKIIEDFKLIYNYFCIFYQNIYSEDINNILQIIHSLENNNLNYFEMKYKKDYDKYIKYLDKAKNGIERINCKFYNQIYIDLRKIYEKDDLKCFEETEIKFNELKKLFEEKGIDKIDEKILILCTNSFNEDKKLIYSELEKLIKIFKISENKNNDINTIKNDIILISKREYIFNATSSIIYFIEQSGAQKGNNTSVIEKVMILSKENTNFLSLKQNIILLKKLGIDFINEENDYLNILIELNQKEEIIKFLFNITSKDCHNLKEILSYNNNSLIALNEIIDIEKCVEFFKGLGKLEDIKLKYDHEIINTFKVNATKTENKQIINHFKRFINNYSRIKEFQSSLVENFIKLSKHFSESISFRLLKNQNIDNQFLFGKYIQDNNNNNYTNNLVNDKHGILSFDKRDPSFIFFSEGLQFFSIMTSFFKRNNNNINLKDNKDIHDIKIKESSENSSLLISNLKKEKEIINELNSKIKKLEALLKENDKEITEIKGEKNNLIKKINDIKNISNNNKINELMDKLEEKEKEIMELNQIFPFEYVKGDKIFIVTFITLNEDIHYSMICKNTDKFDRLEDSFYNKFPEFKKSINDFLIHDKIIDKSNNLESNNIIDNDIIIVKSKKNRE